MDINDILQDAYLVGGAVRDKLLNLPIKDQDWIVVGVTPEQMLAAGFKQVGADFPVFLHPKSQEEYALARTERKAGAGYKGFTCYAGLDVTLEDDLLRRDLTINAMALSATNELIDPYGGQADIQAKTLRHVSDAFSEDPLRVLRVARFASRFAHLGFTVAEETKVLMQQLSDSGELATLTAERMWQETERALTEKSPTTYFQTLRDTHALKAILPEVDNLFGIPQPAKYHPEIDSGDHTLLALKRACELSEEKAVRWAALLHDLGKALSDKEKLPSHHGHEKAGIPLVKKVCDRFRVPTKFKKLALFVCEYHLHTHKAFELRPQTILKMLQACDAWRNPERWEWFLLCCQSDAQGRKDLEDSPYPQGKFLREALSVTQNVSAKAFVEQGLKGEAIKEAMMKERVEALKVLKEKQL